MQPFTRLTGVAVPIPIPNVNTDIIAPKALMRSVSRTGLGWGLFGPYRYGADGAEKPDFILNVNPFREAKIIVALENFGCGSSREHAAWALLDFGVRVVIAISFAEIFFNNCSNNGILLITLPPPDVRRVLAVAETGQQITVDLPEQKISAASTILAQFSITPGLKNALLEGRDEIDMTLTYDSAIAEYEHTMFDDAPWLRGGVTPSSDLLGN
jgi:3-isopropylmalate/(R)-2-methylmalate dehydratase small subunit